VTSAGATHAAWKGTTRTARTAGGGGRGNGFLRATELLLVSLAVALAVAGGLRESPKLATLGFGLATVYIGCHFIRSWVSLVGMLLCVIWFIPIKRYEFPVHLPFNLEPYRVYVAFLMLLWITALLLDRKVRLRSSGIETPVICFFMANLASVAWNFRFLEAQDLVTGLIKGLSFFLSFFLVYFLVVSVTRTREVLEVFVKITVVGGAIVAASGVIEYRTGYNVFNHLSTVFPLLRFEGPLTDIARSGRLRVYASSQHPIALAAALVMVLPLSLYLSLSIRRARWWFMTFLLGLGALSTLSRTGITMLVAVAAVFWWFSPKEFKRLVPLIIPAFVVIFIALPQSLGTLESSFFPKGGLVQDQTRTGSFGNGYESGRLATLGPAISKWEKYPLFGHGFGSRVIDPTQPGFTNTDVQDDQWVDVLLDTGIVGVATFLWIFVRTTRRLRAAARVSDTRDRLMASGLAASVVSFAVGAITYDAFSFIQVTFLFFIMLALASAFLVIKRDEREARRAVSLTAL
jgi:polysaccharide biosynthesis protein PslJ